MSDNSDDAEDGADEDGPLDDSIGFRDGTFPDLLDLRVEELGDGRAVIATDCERHKENAAGVLHGGVTASLIDPAGGMAVGSTFEDEQRPRTTTNLDVTYVRPIADTAYATGEVVRVGDTDAVVSVEVESTAPSGERKRTAVGTVTYRLL